MVEQFFKVINDPNHVRRELLGASKEIIQNLKSYQKILEIREKKTEYLKALRIQVKEINLFLDKLRDNFSADLVAQFKAEHEQKKKIGAKKGKKGKVEKHINMAVPSEITQLETKLAEIESKLKALG